MQNRLFILSLYSYYDLQGQQNRTDFHLSVAFFYVNSIEILDIVKTNS